jgi:hypothetical protein
MVREATSRSVHYVDKEGWIKSYIWNILKKGIVGLGMILQSAQPDLQEKRYE